METKEYQSAPGWTLAHYTLKFESISDAGTYRANETKGHVIAYKNEKGDQPAFVKLGAISSDFSLNTRMTPATARKLAAALIEAADVCERFEAQQAESA